MYRILILIATVGVCNNNVCDAVFYNTKHKQRKDINPPGRRQHCPDAPKLVHVIP
jgi:hypothetical protein